MPGGFIHGAKQAALDIHAPPQHVDLVLELQKDLSPVISTDGPAVSFMRLGGERALPYGGIEALDALETNLSARFEGFADFGARGKRRKADAE